MPDREQMIDALVKRSDRWQRRAMDPDTPTADAPADTDLRMDTGVGMTTERDVDVCECGQMYACPGCGGCMECQVGFDLCASPQPHCASGCWMSCPLCVADRRSGTL